MRKTLVFFVVVAGVLTVLGGLGAGLGLTWLAFQPDRNPLSAAALAAAALVFGAGLGAVWVWAGGQIRRGAPAGPLTLPHWGVLLAALAAVLAAGQVAVSAGWTVPASVLHVLASALPALLFLSLAADGAAWRRPPSPEYVVASDDTPPRAAGRVPARAALSSLAWGGVGATPLAMLLEMALLVILVLFVLAWLTVAHPDLLRQVQGWAVQARGAPGLTPDLSALAPLVTSPVVLLSAFLLLGVLAPLTEEVCKTLAIPLVALAGRRLTRLDGFLLGVAAGAGFAMLEGTAYGILGLQTPGSWASTMLMRAGTAAIHCCASGLAGLGWQALIVERRWGRGVGLGLFGALIHGAWNTLAIGIALPPLLTAANGAAAGSAGADLGQMAGMFTAVACLGLLGLMWLAAVIALPLIARRLAREDAAAAI
jgi:RsiW-degrading membrane proteinase PrsW (M82 family)